MTAPESILQKIKKLQSLATSSNENEANAALTTIERLVAKYNISQEELNSVADKPPAYADDDKLFETATIISWMTQLALAIATKYDCQIVQETIVPTNEGAGSQNYFVYGDPEDVEIVKIIWHAFSKKVEELVVANCPTRGPVYVHSYTEGVVQSIRLNLQFAELIIPRVQLQPGELKPDSLSKSEVLAPTKEERQKPTENTYDVNSDNLIKDIMAYFRGLDDGKNIKLQEVLNSNYKEE